MKRIRKQAFVSSVAGCTSDGEIIPIHFVTRTTILPGAVTLAIGTKSYLPESVARHSCKKRKGAAEAAPLCGRTVFVGV